jgi:hypothetical protein
MSTREGGPVTIASGIKLWVQNANRTDVEEFGKPDELITHKAWTVTKYSLRPGDYITISAGPSFVGARLNYVAQSDRSAGLGKLFGILLAEENNPRHASYTG